MACKLGVPVLLAFTLVVVSISRVEAQGLACTPSATSTGRLTEATYYHPSLAGEPMANGVPYDPRNPLQASSNRYPLGTLLLLSRTDGTASLVVQVMDHGSSTLDLDLSEAGFSRLAPLQAGRVPVCAEPLNNGR
jgi:rare lipoprotein A (peptidoglycan hydrolase)